jgi:hypothetical protein
VIKLRIKVMSSEKFLEVSFDYDLENDTPDKIASEMKNELSLEDIEIERIK